MPQVSIEQEFVNRLQSQIGGMAGQMLMKDIQIEVLMKEKDELQGIVTALGGELPPSQVKRADEHGSGTPQDRGTPGVREAAGPTHQARSPEPQLQHGADSGPGADGAGAVDEHTPAIDLPLKPR